MPTERVIAPYRKASWIVRDVRRRIVEGQYRPGERLPTRVELCGRYGVSMGTIQKALQDLAADGFVEADGRQGTFVSSTSPHLTQYAMLLPASAEWVRGNQFMAALVREAQAMQAADSGRAFQIYYGFETSAMYTDYGRLLDDVENKRLAGLIFAVSPFSLLASPLVRQPGIPRVAIMSLTDDLRQYMSQVYFDGDHLAEIAMATLAQAGRRRPAVLTVPYSHAKLEAKWRDRAERHGLSWHRTALQQVPVGAPEWAANAIELLFRQPVGQRPDCLYVSDDNLLEQSAAALMALGLRVPDDVLLVAHCNFPWPTPSVVPVTRIGFDVRDCLEACMRLIDRQTADPADLDAVTLPPHRESDVALPLHAPGWIGEFSLQGAHDLTNGNPLPTTKSVANTSASISATPRT